MYVVQDVLRDGVHHTVTSLFTEANAAAGAVTVGLSLPLGVPATLLGLSALPSLIESSETRDEQLILACREGRQYGPLWESFSSQ